MDQEIEQLSKDYSAIQLNQSMVSQHLYAYNTYASKFRKTGCELDDISFQCIDEYIEMISVSNKLITLKRAQMSKLEDEFKSLEINMQNQTSQLTEYQTTTEQMSKELQTAKGKIGQQEEIMVN